jgi:cell division protein FtsA
MNKLKTITAIDVGTTKVFSLMANVFTDGNLMTTPEIIATSIAPCNGLKKGNVNDVKLTSAAIKQTLQDLESQTGIKTKSAYVGVTGSHVSYENKRNSLKDIGGHGVITHDELNLTEFESDSDDQRMLLHAMPISYTLDGADGIRNPIGMHSDAVSVDTHVITADRTFITKLTESCKEAGVKVDAFVMEPFASALSTLTDDEREQGALIIDIGGGTTDIIGFKDNRVIYTAVIPVAGFQFTNDIAYTYDSTYESAEKVKMEHGHTELTAIEISKNITLNSNKESQTIEVPARDIGRLLRERSVELAQMVQLKLEELEINGLDTMKIVLTGGGSKLPGIGHLFQRHLGRRVRLGEPNVSWSNKFDDLKHPSQATVLGILIWAYSCLQKKPLVGSQKTMDSNKTNKLIQKLLTTHKKLRLSPWIRPTANQINNHS